MRTTAFCMVITTPIVALAVALGLAAPHDMLVESFWGSMADALVIAPLFENILFILIVEFLLAFSLSRLTIALTIGTLSAIAHGLVFDWRAVAGFVTFAVMAYSYLLWYETRFGARYLLTVAQHALFNLPAALAIASTALP